MIYLGIFNTGTLSDAEKGSSPVYFKRQGGGKQKEPFWGTVFGRTNARSCLTLVN